MNRENFAEYLRNPSRLYQLPYAELRSLVLEYPYSANLRLLLLLKAHQEGDARKEQLLEASATSTFDRSFLQRLLNGSESAEEVLELKDLRELVKLEQPTIEWDVTPPKGQMFTFAPEPPEPPVVVEPEPPAAATEAEPREWNTEEIVDRIAAISAWLKDRAEVPVTLPETNDLIDQLPAGQDYLQQQIEQRKHRALLHLRRRLQGNNTWTVPSVGKEPAVVSETLARLLADQGHMQRAIDAYLQLSLLFPEKSSYFAGIIEELRRSSSAGTTAGNE